VPLRPARGRPRPYVGDGIFPTFVTAADVTTLHATIEQELNVLGAAVVLCATKLDQQTQDEWHAMRERGIAYLADAPDTMRAKYQMDTGQALQRDLAPWHQRIADAGCSVGPAPVAPSSANVLSTISDLKWPLLLGLGFLLLREVKR
jgi:hypothetical protein